MSQQIDRLARNEIHYGVAPGLAIGVIEDGRVVYARGFGYADIAKKTPFAADTETYAGGLTMQFTAAAVLLLLQDGKLKLDDRITRFVPELAHAGATVTIEQLLLQTSGLPDIAGAEGISTDPTRSIKIGDLLAALDKMKPAAPPGTAYANNPLNYIVAGLIVERASNETLSDYLQQQIFSPLVMDRTFLAGDLGISPEHAVGYTHANRPGNFAPVRPWDPAWLLGARGLITTVDDLAKWDLEMPVLLRIDAVRTMFTASGIGGPTQYGMGWVIDRRGGRKFVWYDGEISGYHAANAVLPDDHLAVIVLTNVDTFHGGRVALPSQIAARILDIVAPPGAAHLDNAIVSRAREWLQRLADKRVDRTQLTPTFSTYLSDDFVAREDFASLGKLQAIVPLSSTTETNGDTLYEFLVRYPSVQYHYKFSVTTDGKIDEILLGD